MKEVQPQKDKWSIALYYFILLLSKSISLNFRMHASVYVDNGSRYKIWAEGLVA
jgi:hypothetical protein